MPDSKLSNLSGIEDRTENVRKNLKFSSTCSTYLTLLGYSIAMSDIWRFPFLAYRNGGGAFLIPFLTMAVLLGIPLYFLEYSISKFSGKGPFQVWDVSPLFRGIGICVSLACAIYIAGSTIFRCWILHFLIFAFQNPVPWQSCNNEWNTDRCLSASVQYVQNGTAATIVNTTTMYGNYSILLQNTTTSDQYHVPHDVERYRRTSGTEEFWQNKIIHLSTGMADWSPIRWEPVVIMLFIRVIIMLGLIKSIKSIEKVVYVTATVPFFLTVAIFINSLTLPGAVDGIYYFFYPEFDQLLSVRVWIEATLMVFYTLAFGWGCTMLMGSHADFKGNSIKTAIIVPILDVTAAVFSGLVCFSVLGNMAYRNKVDVRHVIDAGLSTGIVSYITALTSLPLPQLWNVFFLLSLFLTGIESQLIPLDMVMQCLGDMFPKVKDGFRIPALVILSVLLFLVSLPTCTGAGGYIFLWNDWYAAAWVGSNVSLVQLIVVAWIYGLDRFNEDLNMMCGRAIPALLRWALAFLAPFLVTVLLITTILEYVPPKYGTYTYSTLARVAGWTVVTISVAPIILYAFWKVYRTDGNLTNRIRRHLTPLDSWGPGEEEYKKTFDEQKMKYRHRTFKDLLYYNIFGKYPNSSQMNISKVQELTSFGNNML